VARTTIDLFRAARERLARGEPVAMTTVVATRGSTPQKAGARMLICADGQMVGTIGGGCIEAEVWSEARRLLRRRRYSSLRNPRWKRSNCGRRRSRCSSRKEMSSEPARRNAGSQRPSRGGRVGLP
jgi:xanthine/CO dehydrogenase XdhC/CoxF family maturation factor